MPDHASGPGIISREFNTGLTGTFGDGESPEVFFIQILYKEKTIPKIPTKIFPIEEE